MKCARFAWLPLLALCHCNERITLHDCVFHGFAPAQRFPVNKGPAAIATADLDDDQNLDLVVASADTDTVSVFRGDGTGGFRPAGTFTTGREPRSVAIATLDGDRLPDIVTANAAGFDLTLLIGGGLSGDRLAFSPRSPLKCQGACRSVAAADLDGDSHVDLAIVDGGTVTIFYGKDGFVTRDSASASNARFVTAGDLNPNAGPGKDLAIARAEAESHIDVMLRPFYGHPIHSASSAAGQCPISIAVGDFNGDGSPDLAAADEKMDAVTVLIGDGHGVFSTSQSYSYPAGTTPSSVVAADFNGDGVLDLAVANAASNDVSLLLGDGHGAFPAHAKTNFAVGAGPAALVRGDFNHDCLMDIAVVDRSGGDVSILLAR